MMIAGFIGAMSNATEIAMGFACKFMHGIGLLLLIGAPVSSAQETTPRLTTADGKPLEFEVVSVKQNHTAGAKNIISPPMSDGVTITNMPAEEILHWAFGIFLSDQIAGLPGWATQEGYDVTAKVSDADSAAFHQVTDPIQRMPMLQKILTDRFSLRFHYETKELPVYALVVGKGGSRMTEIQPAIGPNGMKEGGGRQLGHGLIKSMGQPMKPLVNQLAIVLGRTVVDRTSLTGYYNFTLRWTPDQTTTQAGSALEADSAPSIFTAVEEQLGLKLESTKAPVKVLVVDRIERPTAN